MSRENPLVSVIIPVHDCERFLAEAVASIRNQSYDNLEIIIIDDGSTDGTSTVIESLGTDIRFLHQSNQGPAAARNQGLKLARGEYIAFLDADDLWVRDKLRSHLERMLKEPEMEVLVGATQRVRAPKGDLSGTAGPGLEADGPVWMLFTLGAGLFRHEVLTSVGNFDESLRQGEDVDWFMRAREAGVNIGISNDVAQLYRIHENNMTRSLANKDRFFLTALKKSLDRRKSGSDEVPDLPQVPGLADFKVKSAEENS